MSFVKLSFRWMTLLVLTSVVCAQSDSATQSVVKNKEAIAAKAKCDKALKDAQDAYIKAQQAAYAEYVKALDKARMDAYKVDNVNEVEALSKEKYRVQEEQKNLEQQSVQPNAVLIKSVNGKVPATKNWTGIVEVKKGQVVTVEASGVWFVAYKDRGEAGAMKNGPDGQKSPHDAHNVIEGAPYGALIGKIGNGKPFVVGSSKEFTVQENGMFFLGPNDKKLDDNDRELEVKVTITVPRR